MTYKEFQHTDTYKLVVGTGDLLTSIANFSFTVIKAVAKASYWIARKTYVWIVH
jgi:hypothetical protein